MIVKSVKKGNKRVVVEISVDAADTDEWSELVRVEIYQPDGVLKFVTKYPCAAFRGMRKFKHFIYRSIVVEHSDLLFAGGIGLVFLDSTGDLLAKVETRNE